AGRRAAESPAQGRGRNTRTRASPPIPTSRAAAIARTIGGSPPRRQRRSGDPRGGPAPAGSGSTQEPTCSFRRVGALDGRPGTLFVGTEIGLRQRRRVTVGRDHLVVDQRELLTRRRSLALSIPHAGIEAAPCQELVMAATLDDDPFIEHEDLVGPNNSGEAMRDDERGA